MDERRVQRGLRSPSSSDSDNEREFLFDSAESLPGLPVPIRSSSAAAGTKPRVFTLEELRYLTEDFGHEAWSFSRDKYEKIYLVRIEKREQMSVQVRHVKVFLRDGTQLACDRFQNELDVLLKLEDPYIPTLVGYTNETQRECTPWDGNVVSVQDIQGALYFKCQPRESLKRFISKERTDWRKLHHIILQTCFGLRNLHDRENQSLCHLDIKPDNIYLPKSYSGKIQLSGFGLSMFCDDVEIKTGKNTKGTPGYMPPEHTDEGIVSKKFDIYSLGVVILEIVAGPTGLLKSARMSRQEFVDLVHKDWTDRLDSTERPGFELETKRQQVKICTEIALNCVQTDRHKRPEIRYIIGDLTKFDMYETSSRTPTFIPNEETEEKAGEAHRDFTGHIATGRISVHPCELCFALEENKWMSSPLSLINKTSNMVGFVILKDDYPKKYYCTDPLVTRVKPMSTILVTVSMIGVPLNTERFAILMINNLSGRVLSVVESLISGYPIDESRLLKRIEFFNGMVHRAVLTADFVRATTIPTTLKIMPLEELGSMCSLDIHPWEPWILASYERDYVSLINCETQSEGIPCQPVYVTTKFYYHISMAKFIARENGPNWIVVAGADDGYIRVHTCPTMKLVKKFKASGGRISSLAVDPTGPYLVSSSPNEEIKLWNWDQGWVCSEGGRRRTISQVKFDPKGTGTFACVNSESLQFWTEMSPFEYTEKFTGACSFDYPFTVSDRRYIIAYFPSGIATICDLQTEEVDHTFTLITGVDNKLPLTACHPTLPLLVTCSDDGTICFLNTNTYRLEKSVRCVIGKLFYVGFISSKSIVIGCHDGIHILEIDLKNIANQQDDI